MYNNPFEIKIQKNLEDLAEVLVPETFRSEAPQYYELVKAMLHKIQGVQDSLNNNMLNLIDPELISSSEVAQIYFNTYLAQLKLDDSKEFLAGTDMLKVAMDLSLKKGTLTLYFILINLLTYLLPGVSNSYSALIEMLKNPELTESERNQILEDISNLKDAGLTSSFVNVEEDVNPFRYKVTADIDMEAFYSFVKPFCHPAGWQMEFVQLINRYVKEKIPTNEKFSILMAFVLPPAEVSNGGVFANQTNNDTVGIESFYAPQPLGPDSEFEVVYKKFWEPTKLYTAAGYIYYDFGQLTFSKFVSDLQFQDFGSTDTSMNKQIRYVEPLRVFPGSVYYAANKAYAANTRDLVSNGGCVSNYGGKLLTYKYVVGNDILTSNSITD